MAEYSSGQERVLKQLVSTLRCKICRRGFEREQVRVTARHDQLWIVSMRCRSCRHQQMFWIAMKEDDAERELGDLTEREQQQFAGMSAVSTNDVLEMHEFLDSFSGDFRGLFSG